LFNKVFLSGRGKTYKCIKGIAVQANRELSCQPSLATLYSALEEIECEGFSRFHKLLPTSAIQYLKPARCDFDAKYKSKELSKVATHNALQFIMHCID